MARHPSVWRSLSNAHRANTPLPCDSKRSECQIATLVATGLSTKALAERLFLSPWTVQDHLTSIFDKTGTRSRRELRAGIFFDEFLPGITGRLTPRPAHPPD
jgi:DNA-binding NarL/FixJ family response regulator